MTTPDVRKGDVWKAVTKAGEQYLLVLTDPFDAPRKPMPPSYRVTPDGTSSWVAVLDEHNHTPRCVHTHWLSRQELVSRQADA